jgi:hypothetical protein
MTLEELAMAAYTAYGDYVDWQNQRGLPMPGWHGLPDNIQGAWMAAVSRVAEQVRRGEEGLLA